MKKYRVVNPVLVRNIPSAEGTIINALNTGTTINVISEDSGWLYTESGNYIFKTDDIEEVNETEEERLIHIYNTMPTSLKAGFAKLHPMIMKNKAILVMQLLNLLLPLAMLFNLKKELHIL